MHIMVAHKVFAFDMNNTMAFELILDLEFRLLFYILLILPLHCLEEDMTDSPICRLGKAFTQRKEIVVFFYWEHYKITIKSVTEIRLKLHSRVCNVTHLEIISHIHEPRGGGDKAPRNVTVPA